jgi:hypothetical protein
MIKKPILIMVCLLMLLCSSVPFVKAQAPVLVYPSNGDTIRIGFPTFTWMTLNIDDNFHYELRLVEVDVTQNGISAIQSNPDWYKSSSLFSPIHTYPFEAKQLESGKTYAWQVKKVKKNTQNESSDRSEDELSDVFVFVYSESEREKICLPLLLQESEARLYVTESYKVIFNTDSILHPDVHQLKYKITNSSGKPIAEKVYPIKIAEGEYKVPLRQYKEFTLARNRNKIYILVATDAKGLSYRLNFTVK